MTELPNVADFVFRWESSADKSNEESLIGTTVSVLGKLEKSQNCLDYPESKYDNLKRGI